MKDAKELLRTCNHCGSLTTITALEGKVKLVSLCNKCGTMGAVVDDPEKGEYIRWTTPEVATTYPEYALVKGNKRGE